MNHGSVFKTGLIVRDLARAIDEIGTWLDLEFTPIQESPLELEVSGQRERVLLRFAYSTQGPSYLELIEAQPTGYYAVDSVGPHLHHVGRWVEDLPRASSSLAEAGLPLEAAGVDEAGQAPSLFAFHRGEHGLRVELVPLANRPTFEAWLAGGTLEI